MVYPFDVSGRRFGGRFMEELLEARFQDSRDKDLRASFSLSPVLCGTDNSLLAAAPLG